MPIDSHEGTAEDLPFADDSFDAVVSQFAMMFVEDRTRALAEMCKVARPGSAAAVAVCANVEASPGYAAFAALLDRLFGRDIGGAFRATFVLRDQAKLLSIARSAGIANATAEQFNGQVRFASIEGLVSTERACAWTLGGLLDADQFARLQAEAQTALAPFVTQDGTITFDIAAPCPFR